MRKTTFYLSLDAIATTYTCIYFLQYFMYILQLTMRRVSHAAVSSYAGAADSQLWAMSRPIRKRTVAGGLHPREQNLYISSHCRFASVAGQCTSES